VLQQHLLWFFGGLGFVCCGVGYACLLEGFFAVGAGFAFSAVFGAVEVA